MSLLLIMNNYVTIIRIRMIKDYYVSEVIF